LSSEAKSSLTTSFENKRGRLPSPLTRTASQLWQLNFSSVYRTAIPHLEVGPQNRPHLQAVPAPRFAALFRRSEFISLTLEVDNRLRHVAEQQRRERIAIIHAARPDLVRHHNYRTREQHLATLYRNVVLEQIATVIVLQRVEPIVAVLVRE